MFLENVGVIISQLDLAGTSYQFIYEREKRLPDNCIRGWLG